jgi:hypothetical protein
MGKEQQAGSSDEWGLASKEEQQARNNHGSGIISKEQPWVGSNNTTRINQKQKKLEFTNYKPCKTNPKTK